MLRERRLVRLLGVEGGQREEVVIDGGLSFGLEVRFLAVDRVYLLIDDALSGLVKLRVIVFVEELLPSQLVPRLGEHFLIVLPGDWQNRLRLDAVVLWTLAVEGVWSRPVVG
jgi:hypothetical protein